MSTEQRPSSASAGQPGPGGVVDGAAPPGGRAGPSAEVLRPSPLSDSAAASLVEEALGVAPDPAFVRAAVGGFGTLQVAAVFEHDAEVVLRARVVAAPLRDGLAVRLGRAF